MSGLCSNLPTVTTHLDNLGLPNSSRRPQGAVPMMRAALPHLTVVVRVSAPRAHAQRKTLRRGSVQRAGAALVEFAILAPLLFTLILGIIEFGRAMMVTDVLN